MTVLALATSCSRQIIPLRTVTHTSSVELIRDTVTLTVTDSSLLEALLECDSLGKVRFRELRAESGRLVRQNVALSDNLLRVKAEAESQQRVRERIVRDTVFRDREVAVPYAEVTYRLRGWQRWLLWIGVFYLVRTGLRVAMNWKKMTLKTLLKLI